LEREAVYLLEGHGRSGHLKGFPSRSECAASSGQAMYKIMPSEGRGHREGQGHLEDDPVLIAGTFVDQISCRTKSYIVYLYTVVSPANGNVSLALVKYSNEGGPGPRYNMKEVPGTILIMLVVHAYPEPLFSEAGDKETSGAGLPPPQQSKLGKAPSRPLQVHTPPLAKMRVETRLGGNHTSASDSRSEAIDWARGGCGDHFGLFRASLRGQAAELETSAGQPRAFLKALL
jgi:hypothetical protein